MKWNVKKTWHIKQHERGILLKDGDVEAILSPGIYQRWDWKNQFKVEIVDIRQHEFSDSLMDFLRRQTSEYRATYVEELITDETTAVLRYEDDVLAEIVPPDARRYYWKGFKVHRLDRVALTDVRVADTHLTQLTKPSLRGKAIAGLAGIQKVMVPAYSQGVLRIDGKITGLLAPGVHAFWQYHHEVEVGVVDVRLQTLEVNGQEILTKDKVNLRINLTAVWQMTDLLKAMSVVAKPADHLYRELQFVLRELVATRTLDELLEDKHALDALITARFEQLDAEMGMRLVKVGMKDIILPGEMKNLLAQVVEAEKAAEANVIRRREEAANTRTMLNTAKLMEENPVTMRLKELETLERIANRIDKISVFGGLDQVLNGLVKIG